MYGGLYKICCYTSKFCGYVLLINNKFTDIDVKKREETRFFQMGT